MVILVVIYSQILGQTKTCETVYQTVDKSPTYEKGMSALMDYSGKHLAAIISKYHERDEELTAKVIMLVTIDIDGKVVDAVLSNHKLPQDCVDEIRKQLLTMTGWTPGILNGEKVCSKFAWAIGCIKWG